MNHRKGTRYTFQDLNQDLNDLYDQLKKRKYKDDEIRQIFLPVTSMVEKSRYYFVSLCLFVILSASVYLLTYCDSVYWHLSAVLRISMIKLLPYFDWRYLKNEPCLVPPLTVIKNEGAGFNCYACETIRDVAAYDTIEENFLIQRYLDMDVPVILTKGIDHWKKTPADFFENLAREDDLLLSYPCNLATNVYGRDIASDVETLVGKLETFESFFVHFQNCDKNAMRAFRKYTFRPDFLPDVYSPTTYNWLIWNKDYNCTNYKKLDLVEKVTVFGQIYGKTRVRLSPRLNCKLECQVLEFALDAGDYVIFTSLWDLEYRPFETGHHLAAIMETRN